MIIKHKGLRVDNQKEVEGFFVEENSQSLIVTENSEKFLVEKESVRPSIANTENSLFWVNDIIFSVFPDIKKGVMVCGDCFVCDDLLKTELKLEYSATACDMETAAAAAVCYKFDIPFVAIRRISDDAGDNADVLYKKAKTKYEELLMDMALKVVENIG